MATPVVFTVTKSFHWKPEEPCTIKRSYNFVHDGTEYTLPIEATQTQSWRSLYDNGLVTVVSGWTPSSGGGTRPPISFDYAATYAPDCSAADVFQCALVTGDIEILVPTNGENGSRVEVWLTASGGDHSLSFDTGILLPSDSGLVLPKTLVSGKTYIVLLKSNGSMWCLTSLVGGYENLA